jgi:hypothetical protein
MSKIDKQFFFDNYPYKINAKQKANLIYLSE